MLLMCHSKEQHGKVHIHQAIFVFVSDHEISGCELLKYFYAFEPVELQGFLGVRGPLLPSAYLPCIDLSSSAFFLSGS